MVGVAIVAGVSAAATVYSGQQQASAAKKQAQAQNEANRANQAAASAQAARQRVEQARAQRIAAGRAVQAGVNTGGGVDSSKVTGAVSSATSQAAANIGAINVQETFAEQASQALQRAANYGAQAAKWQAIGGFSKSIFSWSTSGISAGSLFGNTGTNTIGKP